MKKIFLLLTFLIFTFLTTGCVEIFDLGRHNPNDPKADNFLASDLEVKFNDLVIKNGKNYCFGTTVPGVYKELKLQIKNNGNKDLVFKGSTPLVLKGDDRSCFVVFKQPKNKIASGESVTAVLRYYPTDDSEKRINVEIECNDRDQSLFSFCFYGKNDQIFYRDWKITGGTSTTVKAVGQNVYAAGPGGTIYKSTNRGKSWSQVGSILSAYILKLESDGQYLYAGGYKREKGLKKIVLKRIPLDGTADWQNYDDGLPTDSVNSITTLHFDGQILYTATEYGRTHVYYFDQESSRWKQYGLNSFYRINSITSGNGKLYLGVIRKKDRENVILSEAVYQIDANSPNGNWQPLNSAISNIPFNLSVISLLCVEQAGKKYLYAGLERHPSEQLIYRYDFDSRKWVIFNTGLPTGLANSNLTKIKTLCYHNGYLFTGAYDGLYKMKHGQAEGHNWILCSSGGPQNPAIDLSPDGTMIYGTSNSGVAGHHGLSMSPWYNYNNGIASLSIKNIKDNGPNLFAIASGYGLIKYNLEDQSFIPICDQNYISDYLVLENKVIFSKSDRVYYFTDSNPAVLPFGSGDCDEIYKLVVHNGFIYGAGESGLYYISINGGQWQKEASLNTQIKKMHADDSYLYLYLNEELKIVKVPFNNLSSQTDIFSFSGGDLIEGICHVGNVLYFVHYVGSSDKSILYRYQAGKPLLTVGSDLPARCTGLTTYNGNLFVGTRDGKILRIKEDSDLWEIYSDGIPDAVSDLENSIQSIHLVNDILFVGTKSSGLWRTK